MISASSKKLAELVCKRAKGLELSCAERQWLATQAPWINPDISYQILPRIYPKLKEVCDRLDLELNYQSLWLLYLPLAIYLSQQQPPFILGIFGMQGTGKTTLTKILQAILQPLTGGAIVLSLDDLYKTYADRLALQKNDPRLRWRGVPSTHDIYLGEELLENFCQQKYPLSIPRFDKLLHHGQGDRIIPEIVYEPADILLFEGWFTGLKPLPVEAFQELCQADQEFAIHNNHQLVAYQKLWSFIDYLIALVPNDYHISLKWRSQADKSAMTQSEISEFVHYFWQALPPHLFLPAISNYADLVVEVDDDRTVQKIKINKYKKLKSTKT